MNAISSEPISFLPISSENSEIQGIVSRLPSNSIPYSGYGGQGFQVFTPNRVEVIVANDSLTTTQTHTHSKVTAIRSSANLQYQLNGTGAVGTLYAGNALGISSSVISIKFPNGGTIEVM
jgi:hypothetical protein